MVFASTAFFCGSKFESGFNLIHGAINQGLDLISSTYTTSTSSSRAECRCRKSTCLMSIPPAEPIITIIIKNESRQRHEEDPLGRQMKLDLKIIPAHLLSSSELNPFPNYPSPSAWSFYLIKTFQKISA